MPGRRANPALARVDGVHSALALCFALVLASSGGAQTPAAPEVESPRAEPPADGQENQAAAEAALLELPLLVGEIPVGDIVARVWPDGRAAVSPPRLAKLLEKHASAKVIAALARMPDAELDPAAISVDGLAVAYDPSRLSIVVTLAADATDTRTLALVPANSADPGAAAQPASLAAGLTVFARPSWVHKRRGGSGFEPFRADFQGFVSTGGFDGWVLLYEFDYDGGRDRQWVRREVVAIHDDFDRAIRYRLGDFRPSVFGYQQAVDLVGISVERNYQEIQPFRNLQPRGQTSFTLEERARVSVEVNGVVTLTRDLEPGSYDVRDFPFSQGANDVRILVDDGVSTREIANFSAFAALDLLGRGINRFGASAGFLRDPVSFGRIRYSNDPAFSGFYERGISDVLTLGGQFEASSKLVMGGVTAAYGTPLGLFLLRSAASTGGSARTGFAATLRYRLPSAPIVDDWTLTADAQVEHRSKHFRVLGDLLFPLGKESRVDARVTARSPRLTFGASYSDSTRFEGPTYSLFATSYIGRLSATLTFQSAMRPGSGGEQRQNRILFSLSRRLGKDQFARARYATNPSELELEWQRFSDRDVGDLGARVNLQRNSDINRLEGELEYVHSRFEAEIRQTIETEENGLGLEEARTDARFGVGFGWADGTFAFGRPFTNGFIILKPHQSLGSRKVALREGVGGPVRGVSNRLGPGLAPIEQSYQNEEFIADVENLPIGYDIGEGRLVTFANERAGYVYEVGSGAANTILGVLVDAKGAPVALAAGELVPVSAKDSDPVPFFTNSTGRMVAEGVGAGCYDIVLTGDRKVGTIEVPEGEAGVVDIGTVRLGGE